jgi:uncharacterized paraquat-inducible protein A
MPRKCQASFANASHIPAKIQSFPDSDRAQAMNTLAKTAIVCGSCNAINYRANEITCKKCGDYFPTPARTEIKKQLVNSDLVIAVFTFVIASVI